MINLRKFQRFFLEAWAYLVEALAASGFHILLVSLFSSTALANFIIRSGKDWATLEGVLLAAAIVIWAIYFNFLGSDFGGYLRWDHSERVFRWAFGFGVFIHLVAVVLLIVVSNLGIPDRRPPGTNQNWLVHLAFWVLCLALLNVPSMFVNTLVLVRLKGEFESQRKNFLKGTPPKNPPQ